MKAVMMGRDDEGEGEPEGAGPKDPVRAIGVAETELLYAAAELRSAASRGDLDNRALLYNLADGLQSAAARLLTEAEEAFEEGGVAGQGAAGQGAAEPESGGRPPEGVRQDEGHHRS